MATSTVTVWAVEYVEVEKVKVVGLTVTRDEVSDIVTVTELVGWVFNFTV